MERKKERDRRGESVGIMLKADGDGALMSYIFISHSVGGSATSCPRRRPLALHGGRASNKYYLMAGRASRDFSRLLRLPTGNVVSSVREEKGKNADAALVPRAFARRHICIRRRTLSPVTLHSCLVSVARQLVPTWQIISRSKKTLVRGLSKRWIILRS